MNRVDRRVFVTGAAALTIAGGHVVSSRGHHVSTAAAADRWPSIKDDAGHEMPYFFRPAADPPNSRTLVILHAHGGNEQPASPDVPIWNVLSPLDRYGWHEKGSWWLGEGGDFFTLRLLHRLIARTRKRTGGDRGLYFYGTSMGGYGALLHGMLAGARAVYADAMQTKLRGTAFTDDYLGAATSAVVGGTKSRFADLGGMVRRASPRDLPVFFLGFNRYDHNEYRYFAEHFVPFLAACGDADANVSALLNETGGHEPARPFAEVLGLFDAHRGAIEAW